MSVISRVLKILEQKKIKPIELQRATSIPPSSFTEWKNGRNPKHEAVVKMADFLGVSTEFLYGNAEAIEKKDLSQELQELGYEYVKVIKDAKTNDIAAEDLQELVDIAKKHRKNKK